MPLFPSSDESAIYFSMFDQEQAWCRITQKPFTLDGVLWKTAEHYYQATKFIEGDYREKVRASESADVAIRLGKAWFKPKRKNWKQHRKTMMSRALYTQCQVYPEMAEAILQTGDQRLVESSQYNYFWGCGRDRRGENQFGQVLMGIRTKLRESHTGSES